jgi:hypothetical protein
LELVVAVLRFNNWQMLTTKASFGYSNLLAIGIIRLEMEVHSLLNQHYVSTKLSGSCIRSIDIIWDEMLLA